MDHLHGGGSIIRTGPFLQTVEVPDRATCLAQIGRPLGGELVLYAPRGFPFGREFGDRVLAAVYEAVAALRATTHPRLELQLLAVDDPEELGVIADPENLPGWVHIGGVVTPQQSLIFTRAANIVIAEDTSTMHEACALRTALVLVPGPIQEATLLARCLGEHRAADVFDIATLTSASLAATFRNVLGGGPLRTAMTARAYDLITGGGGVEAAARLVHDIAQGQRATSVGQRSHAR